MLKYWAFIVLPFAVMGSPMTIAQTTEPGEVKIYQFQKRYEFGAQLLELALSKLDKPYKVITPNAQHENEARGEWRVVNGELDLQWLSTSVSRERKMIPIRIPIYRGILGLRLLLVESQNHTVLSSVQNLKQLQQFIGGHGAHWGDLPVYKANDLPVLVHSDYETLFLLLKAGRFDYFHRGLNEIWQEYDAHKDSLKIVDNIMLFYPHPIYFFVSPKRPELAKDLKIGIERALEDGSYKALFFKYHKSYINSGGLDKRKLIRLHNPVLPKNAPQLNTDWWLPRSLTR